MMDRPTVVAGQGEGKKKNSRAFLAGAINGRARVLAISSPLSARHQEKKEKKGKKGGEASAAGNLFRNRRIFRGNRYRTGVVAAIQGEKKRRKEKKRGEEDELPPFSCNPVGIRGEKKKERKDRGPGFFRGCM